MIQLLATADPVRLAFARQVLEAAEIPTVVIDPGPWGGAMPSRLMVPEDELELARQALAEAEAALDAS
jgi:hypothetical protein